MFFPLLNAIKHKKQHIFNNKLVNPIYMYFNFICFRNTLLFTCFVGILIKNMSTVSNFVNVDLFVSYYSFALETSLYSQ